MNFRRALYVFQGVVLCSLLLFKAEVHFDTSFCVYVFSILISNILMVVIRQNPGVVSLQIIDPESLVVQEKPDSEELEVDQRTNYQLGKTLKMRELQTNLLEPEISLRAPYNISELRDLQDDDIEAEEHQRDRYSSVETIRDQQ